MHSLFFRTSPRGASLATVMMVVAMMLTLGFTVVAIAFNHLNLSFKTSNQTQANHLAEAVLAKAIDQIVKDQEFGLYGTASEKTVRITRPSSPNEMFHALPQGSEGVLTFDQDYATSQGIPYSTNNRSEAGVSGSAGVPVPGESFHLVATARVKNCTSRMEAIVSVPQFPFSVAADGSIRSEGGLVVASVKPGVAYDLNYPIHEDDLRPGHLVSNSKIGDEAVVLAGENKIYGDLQSSSGVTLEADTAIFGEVRTNAADESLPRLNVTDYDPEFKPGLQVVNSGAGTLAVEGYNKSYGDLTVDNGIELNGGVLYVDGNLLVSAGGVTGKGALVATGDIRIYGDGEAHTDNQAALIADGDIVLKGSSTEKAKFAGLIYTEGQLDAENLRLAGVFVAAGDDSSVEFKNTEVYEDPTLGSIDLGGQTVAQTYQIPTTLTPPAVTLGGNSIAVQYDISTIQNSLESYRNPNQSPGQPEFLFKVPTEYPSVGYLAYNFDPESGAVSHYTVPDSNIHSDPHAVNGLDLGLSIYGTKVTSLQHAQDLAVAGMTDEFGPMTAAQENQVRNMAKVAFDSTGAANFLSKNAAEYTLSQQSGDPTDPGGGDPAEDFNWSLDLSEFFSESKQMHVLYWGVYTE